MDPASYTSINVTLVHTMHVVMYDISMCEPQ